MTFARKVVVAARAAPTTATLATGGWRVTHRPAPDVPKDPEITYSQDEAGVHVRIHNVNDHWILRNQPAKITLRTAEGLPIRVYGPDDVQTIDAKPGPSIRCCFITYLGPGGEYTFDLFPTRVAVGGLSITLRGGDKWVHL